METRVKFSGKLATVLVAAGSSVGLGNIWRFPYVAGENGGGAFLLIYLAAIFIIGLPVMMAEMAVGRAAQRSSFGAFKALSNGWRWLGLNSTLVAFLILGYYYVVAGWTAEYFVYAVDGTLAGISQPEEYKSLFASFVVHPWKPVVYTWVFILMTHLIIYSGVKSGLERVSKVLMPLFFVILIALAINSLLLPGSWEGVKFFLYPDFSALSRESFLQALGQAFMSLSIGMGALVTYGSYMPKDARLGSTTMQVMGLDTIVAIIAGFMIFPATASVGIDPTAGPALVFETLPAIFNTLPMSSLWATIFFLLLIIAALTSTMSLHEVCTTFFMEEFSLSRKWGATLTSVGVALLGTAASLSMGDWAGFTIAGMPLFDILDYVTTNIMLPLGGMLISIFVGWQMDHKLFENQVTNNGALNSSYLLPMRISLRYIAPISIFVIFLDSVGLI